VPAPLDIILTPALLEQYNAVFHLLLQLRRAAAALADVWASFNSARAKDPRLHALQLFRHEMRHYVGIVQHFVVTQAVDACWRRLEEALAAGPQSVDHVRRVHAECLEAMQRRCLLHDRGRPVMEALQRMLAIVIATREQIRGAPIPLPPAVFERVMATRAMFARCGEFLYSILSKFGEKTRELDIEALVLQINFNGWIVPRQRG
jgi:gamma-tubulin complex component 6